MEADPRTEGRRRICSRAALLDTKGQAVIGTDTGGEILYWSRAAEELYGWTREEILGRNVLTVTPAGGSRVDAATIMAQLRAGRSWSGEFRVRHQDGSEFWARVVDTPVRDDDGELIGIVGISQPSSNGRGASPAG